MYINTLVQTSIFSSLLAAFAVASPLLIVEGRAAHGPENHVEPPTREELIEKARNQAINNLLDKNSYVQISQWREQVTCDPIFQGSSRCYKGSAFAAASFIAKDNQFESQSIAISASVHWHRQNENDANEGAMNEAREKAWDDARFFCNSNVEELPKSRIQNVRSATIEWQCMESNYRAVFQCMK